MYFPFLLAEPSLVLPALVGLVYSSDEAVQSSARDTCLSLLKYNNKKYEVLSILVDCLRYIAVWLLLVSHFLSFFSWGLFAGLLVYYQAYKILMGWLSKLWKHLKFCYNVCLLFLSLYHMFSVVICCCCLISFCCNEAVPPLNVLSWLFKQLIYSFLLI